jgi:integrase
VPRVRANKQGGLIRYKNCANWFGQYYDVNGKQHRQSTGTPIKAEAESILRKWMADSERGLKPSPETKGLTYDQLKESLIESFRTKGNKSLQVRADGTETINPLPALDEFFTGKKVSRIDSDAVRSFVRHRQKLRIGNACINNSLSLLRRMFSIARKEGRLQAVPYIELLKPPPARKGFVQPKDFSKLLNALTPRLRPLIVFLYYSGLRLGEAKQVQWESVDLNRACITLEEGTTKSGEQRIVPIPDALVEMLRAVKKKEGTVFDSAALRYEWDKAKSACGLDDLLVHDLRRSAIRNLTLAGVSQHVSMRISGHRTDSVFRRYNIVSTEQLSDAMKRVEQMLPVKIQRALPARRAGRVARG